MKSTTLSARNRSHQTLHSLPVSSCTFHTPSWKQTRSTAITTSRLLDRSFLSINASSCSPRLFRALPIIPWAACSVTRQTSLSGHVRPACRCCFCRPVRPGRWRPSVKTMRHLRPQVIHILPQSLTGNGIDAEACRAVLCRSSTNLLGTRPIRGQRLGSEIYIQWIIWYADILWAKPSGRHADSPASVSSSSASATLVTPNRCRPLK